MLVHRWRRHHHLAPSSSSSSLPTPTPTALYTDGNNSPTKTSNQNLLNRPEQLRHVCVSYHKERLRVLKSIENLLLLGEGWSGSGAFADAIEETLSTLLTQTQNNMEEVAFESLKRNVATATGGAGLLPPPRGGGEDSPALERNVLLSILALIYFHPRKQCTPDRFVELARLMRSIDGLCNATPLPEGWTPSSNTRTTATPTITASQVSVKLAALLLLEVLALDADKALAAVANGGVVDVSVNAFLEPSVRDKVDAELCTWRPSSGSPPAAVLLAWSAILSLAGARGAAPQAAAAAAAHAAIATAADALAALCDLSSPHGLQPAVVDMAGTILYSTVCMILTAFQLDPLTLPVHQAQQAVDMLCNIFTHHPTLCESFWAAAMATSSTSLSLPATATATNRGHHQQQQSPTPEGFTALPFISFLDSLSSLFPAFGIPLLRLLTALAAEAPSPAAAASAYLYFSKSTSLAWLHQLPHPCIAAASASSPFPGGNPAMGVVITSALDLPGALGLTLVPGVLGAVIPFEPNVGIATFYTTSTAAATRYSTWVPGVHPTQAVSPSGTSVRPRVSLESTLSSGSLHAIRWLLPDESETRPWALLCRSFGALRAILAPPPPSPSPQTSMSETDVDMDKEAALIELNVALGFFAAVCCGDPGTTAITLLRLEAPHGVGVEGWGGGALSGEAPAPARNDVLALAFHSINLLCNSRSSSTTRNEKRRGVWNELTSSAVKHSFSLCAAFVPTAAGRVASDLLSCLGITPLDIIAATSSTTRSLPGALTPPPVPTAPVLRQIIALEGEQGEYVATHALLSLLISLLQSGRPDPGLVTLVSFVLQRIAPEMNAWKFASARERWIVAERCITLTRHALLADGGDGSIIGVVAASILQTESGVAACLLPLLPPPATVLEDLSSSVNHQLTQHVEAAEACCVAWLRLIPVLLPPHSSSLTGWLLSPAAFLRAPTTQNSGSTSPAMPAAAVLLSFLSYPYFDARERALVVRAMHCFVAAATAALPDLPLLPLLPQQPPQGVLDSGSSNSMGGMGVSHAARAVLAHALSPSMALSYPTLFGAVCDVLSAAVAQHPSLVDALLFSDDDDAYEYTRGVVADGKENKLALVSAPTTATTTTPTRKSPKDQQQYTCLDALWNVLDDWKSLLDTNPFAIAKAMHVVAALWQAGAPAFRALTALQHRPRHPNPTFWSVVIGIITHPPLTGQNQGGEIVAPSGNITDDELTREAWGGEALMQCWRVVAEHAAFDILTAACFLYHNTHYKYTVGGSRGVSIGHRGHTTTMTKTAAEGSSGMDTLPQEVMNFISGGQGWMQYVPILVRRYCTPLPIISLERDIRRLAAATGAELLATAVQDEVLWLTLRHRGGLLSELSSALHRTHAMTEGETETETSPTHKAVHALSELSNAVLGPSGSRLIEQNATLASFASVLLHIAEVPGRLISDHHHHVGAVNSNSSSSSSSTCSYGPSFVYDGALLGRRVGVALAQEVRLLDDLKEWLSCVSVGLSIEEARGGAAAALDAFSAVAEAVIGEKRNGGTTARGGTHDESGVGTVGDIVEALRAVLVDGVVNEARAEGALHQVSDTDGVGVGMDIVATGGGDLISAGRHESNNNDDDMQSSVARMHLNSAAAAAQIALLAFPRGQDQESKGKRATTTSLLQLTSTWFESMSTLRSYSKSGSDDVDKVCRCLLAMCLHSIDSFSGGTDSTGSTNALPEAAQSLFTHLVKTVPDLGTCPHGAAAATLAAAIVKQQLLPPPTWLPLLSHHLHFAHSLSVALQRANQMGNNNNNNNNNNNALVTLEAILLFALQAAQVPKGAELLIEQGVAEVLLSLGAWCQAPSPHGGNLLGLSPQSSVDYSNAYTCISTAGSSTYVHAIEHRLWCATLGAMGLLVACAPTDPRVLHPALQLVIRSDARIQLAVSPPAATDQQPVTLAMAQEARYALFLLCGVARQMGGQWRMALPHAIPALRRATASLLAFIAEGPLCSPATATPTPATSTTAAGSAAELVCAAVTEIEQVAAKAPAPNNALSSAGWFGVPIVPGTESAAASMLHPPSTALTWDIAEQLYACAHYALIFQLGVMPEVSEAEAVEGGLGAEWPTAVTLRTLCEQCIEVIDPGCAGHAAANPVVKRVLKMMVAVLRGGGQVLEVVGPRSAAATVREGEAAMERARAILSTHQNVV